MTKVITITDIGNKSGKTLNTVNLATWLALLGQKVLVIDLTTEAITTQFFTDKDFIANTTLEDVFIEDKSMDSAILESQVKNLFILPSVNMNDLFLKEVFTENSFILRDLIDNLEQKFDFIFLDTYSENEIFLKTALNSSDQVLFLVKTEENDELKNIDFINKIIEISENNNKWLEISGIIFTFYSENLKSKEIISNYKSKFGNIIYKTIIPKNFTISESFNSLIPLALYDIKSFVSDIYLRLAREFLQNNNVKI
ncbi:MAG: ParA family protein [Candidatus Sericytochromatia bacterium]